jgi:integrase
MTHLAAPSRMELLSARWDAFDLDAGIWTLAKESTKTRASIRIPLAEPVLAWRHG